MTELGLEPKGLDSSFILESGPRPIAQAGGNLLCTSGFKLTAFCSAAGITGVSHPAG